MPACSPLPSTSSSTPGIKCGIKIRTPKRIVYFQLKKNTSRDPHSVQTLWLRPHTETPHPCTHPLFASTATDMMRFDCKSDWPLRRLSPASPLAAASVMDDSAVGRLLPMPPLKLMHYGTARGGRRCCRRGNECFFISLLESP